MKYFLIISIFLITFTSVQANVFGENTRKAWDSLLVMPNPLDRTGTLKHPSGERCTAAYIGGNLLITAAHCVMKKGKDQLQKGDYLFEHILLSNGHYRFTKTITHFHYVELRELVDLSSAKHHWVILEMNSPMVNPDRFFGYNYPLPDSFNEYHESNFDLSIIGFSPEFNGRTKQLTFSDSNCEIKEHLFDSFIALHNCDSGPRDSGAPLYKCTEDHGIWKECSITAIHVGSYSATGMNHKKYARSRSNLAVTIKSFKDAIYYLRAGGPRPNNLNSVSNF